MRTNEMLTGVSNSIRLHIHEEPHPKSLVICKVRYLTDLLIDLEESTEEYYKVFTATGVEGFCEKEFVTLR